MSVVLRDPASGEGSMDGWVRGVGILSASGPDPSGSVVLLDFDQENNNLIVRFSNDRTSFGVIGSTAAAGKFSGMAVDSANGIHIAYHRVNPSQEVRYRKYTYSGSSTWSAGSEEVVYTPGVNWEAGRRDIDVLDSGVVVMALLESNEVLGQQRVRIFVRTTGGTWVPGTIATSGTITDFTNNHLLSVCRDPVGSSGGSQKIAMLYSLNNRSTGLLKSMSINLSTGAFTSVTTIDNSAAGVGGALGSGVLFATGANEITVGCFAGGRAFAQRFRTTDNVVLTPRTGDDFRFTAGPGDPHPTFAFLNNRLICVGRQDQDGVIRVAAKVCDLSVPGVATWYAGNPTFLPAGGPGNNSYVDWSWSGANRNFNLNRLDVIFGLKFGGRVLHEYNRPVPAPTDLQPGQGSTITTDRPVLRETVEAPSGTLTTAQKAQMPPGPWVQFPRKGRWDLAKDSAFTVSLRTVVEGNVDFRLAGAASETPDALTELNQGFWYLRGAAEDQLGVRSSFTTAISFAISHPPGTTSQSPNGGRTTVWTLAGTVLTFVPTDPSPYDSMTAYQIDVTTSDGTMVLNTGKITRNGNLGDVQSVSVPIPAADKDLPLNWKVRTWDTDDVQGTYSTLQAFRVSDPPLITIVQPVDGGTVDTPAPTTLWDIGLTGGRSQAFRRVIFTLLASLQPIDPEDPTSAKELVDVTPTIVHDSGRQASIATSYTPAQAILTNGSQYEVMVAVSDTVGLEAQATVTTTVEYVEPTEPVFQVNTSYFTDYGYVQVTWTDNEIDSDFYSWRVYRQDGNGPLILLAEETEQAGAYEYRDWLVGSGVTAKYIVTQIATRFGTLVESVSNPVGAVPVSEDYWLIDQFDELVNVRFGIVTDESFTDEYEEETYNLIGRGRFKEYGTHWGYTGSLTAQIRDESWAAARTQRLRLEYLKGLKRNIYLRNPFGDVWEVAPGTLSIARVPGVGQREFVDVTFPYEEMGVRELPVAEYTGGVVATVTRAEVEQMVAAESQARAEALQAATDNLAGQFGGALSQHNEDSAPHGPAKLVQAGGSGPGFKIFNQIIDPSTDAEAGVDLWAK